MDSNLASLNAILQFALCSTYLQNLHQIERYLGCQRSHLNFEFVIWLKLSLLLYRVGGYSLKENWCKSWGGYGKFHTFQFGLANGVERIKGEGGDMVDFWLKKKITIQFHHLVNWRTKKLKCNL